MNREQLHLLTKPVAGDLEAFDKRLTNYLATESKMINSVARHILASRGKRLRPAMLFLAARSGGMRSPRLVDAALAIELIHTATLLHDDVVDESDVRRGQDTINYRWNNLVSVLMGDFLFSKAFYLLVSIGSPKLIKSVSHATERVSYGELRQIEEAANFDLCQKDYIRIISDKTASLFATACEAGPIIKKAEASVIRKFHRFGENIGIAFQITDDLLDFIGESSKTGKEAGSDLIQGKVTLPLIYSLDRSSQKVRNEITGYLNNGINKKGTDHVVQFVTEQGGLDYAYGVARKYSERAGNIFSSLKNNIYSRTLRELMQFTVARDN